VLFCGLTYQKDKHLAIIEIAGWGKGLKKRAELLGEFLELCCEIRAAGEIRVVVLKGTSVHAFSLGEYLISGIVQARKDGEIKLSSPAESIANLNQPVIAAINGDAVGSGLEFALACDIRVAADTAHFGFPHIKEGLIPWDGGTQRLSRVVGQAKAMEIILTGELIDAEEAYRMGLVNNVVPHDAVMATAMNMAREMASKGPIALRYAKEAIRNGMDLTLDQGLRLEADLYFLLHTTKDRTEGIRAFQEKRKPEFEGK